MPVQCLWGWRVAASPAAPPGRPLRDEWDNARPVTELHLFQGLQQVCRQFVQRAGAG